MLVVAVVAALAVLGVSALNNGVGRTPGLCTVFSLCPFIRLIIAIGRSFGLRRPFFSSIHMAPALQPWGARDRGRSVAVLVSPLTVPSVYLQLQHVE